MGHGVDLAQLPATQTFALSRRGETGGWSAGVAFPARQPWISRHFSARAERSSLLSLHLGAGSFSTSAFSGFPDFPSDSRATAWTKETRQLPSALSATCPGQDIHEDGALVQLEPEARSPEANLLLALLEGSHLVLAPDFGSKRKNIHISKQA